MMFTADFGYQQLLKWMKESDLQLAVIARDEKTIINLIVHEVPAGRVNRTTGRITLQNNTIINFYHINDANIHFSGCTMRGAQWHFVWGHQTPTVIREIAEYGLQLGDYPVGLFTE